MVKLGGMREVVLIKELAIRWLLDIGGGISNVNMNFGKKCDRNRKMGERMRNDQKQTEAEGDLSR
jgi:hypothetical protein